MLAVENHSEAERAGLRPTQRDVRGNVLLGDIITAVDDQAVRSTGELFDAFEQHEPGDQVTLSVIYNGQLRKVTVPLEVGE